jgi:mersacidin/lichenicidin family type 2 lantibiotic
MKLDIARAWKDEAYRQSLSNEERALLPENPVGEIELTDADLAGVQGAKKGQFGFSFLGNNCINNPHHSYQGVCNSFGSGQCFSFAGNCQSNRGDCHSYQGDCSSTQGTCNSNGGQCNSVGACLTFSSGPCLG